MTAIHDRGGLSVDPLAYPSDSGLRFPLFVLTGAFISWFYGDYLTGLLLHWQFIAGPLRVTCAFAVMTLAFVLAYAWYRTAPARLIHRFRLRDADEREKEVIVRISALCTASGVALPRIMIANRPRGQNAQVFGRRSSYILRLDSGLRLALRKAPALFDAVINHELAHIKGQDVERAYYARSFFEVLVLMAILLTTDRLVHYYALEENVLRSADLTDETHRSMVFLILANFLLCSVQLPLILVVLVVEYARVVRVRETFADWLSTRAGSLEGLRTILKNGIATTVNLAARLFRFHPSPSERLAMLERPALYYQDSLLDSACLGGLGTMLVLLLSFVIKNLEVASDVRTDLSGIQQLFEYPLLSAGIWLGSSLAIVFFLYILSLLSQRIFAGALCSPAPRLWRGVRLLLSHTIAAGAGGFLVAAINPDVLVKTSVFMRPGIEPAIAQIISDASDHFFKTCSMYFGVLTASAVLTFFIFRASRTRRDRPTGAFHVAAIASAWIGVLALQVAGTAMDPDSAQELYGSLDVRPLTPFGVLIGFSLLWMALTLIVGTVVAVWIAKPRNCASADRSGFSVPIWMRLAVQHEH